MSHYRFHLLLSQIAFFAARELPPLALQESSQMARVLLVEPDRQVRQFIAGILSDIGHKVAAVADSATAFSTLRRNPVDLIATDLVLDDAAGDLAALTRRVLIVTLSGRRFRANGDKYAGPRHLREKPFRFSDLRSLLAAAETSEAAFAAAAEPFSSGYWRAPYPAIKRSILR